MESQTAEKMVDRLVELYSKKADLQVKIRDTRDQLQRYVEELNRLDGAVDAYSDAFSLASGMTVAQAISDNIFNLRTLIEERLPEGMQLITDTSQSTAATNQTDVSI